MGMTAERSLIVTVWPTLTSCGSVLLSECRWSFASSLSFKPLQVKDNKVSNLILVRAQIQFILVNYQYTGTVHIGQLPTQIQFILVNSQHTGTVHIGQLPTHWYSSYWSTPNTQVQFITGQLPAHRYSSYWSTPNTQVQFILVNSQHTGTVHIVRAQVQLILSEHRYSSYWSAPNTQVQFILVNSQHTGTVHIGQLPTHRYSSYCQNMGTVHIGQLPALLFRTSEQC